MSLFITLTPSAQKALKILMRSTLTDSVSRSLGTNTFVAISVKDEHYL